MSLKILKHLINCESEVIDMVDMNAVNPIIGDPTSITAISFYQTRDTLMDTEEYSKFIYSVENQFRRSRFYKDYKGSIMNRGIDFDQIMRNINGEMADIEMHHMLPTLKDAAIAISEYYLITTGKVCTFDVIKALEEAHRENMMAVVMLTSTMHQNVHQDPNAFIPISMCYGNPFKFLDKYGKYFSLDIAFKWLLQFKQEEQHNYKVYWPNIARAREQLLDWSNSGYIQY